MPTAAEKAITRMPRKQDIRLERLFPHPPELVWRALTDPDAIAQWLAPTTFRPVVGTRFMFDAPGNSTGVSALDAEVTVADEPRQIAYTLTSAAMKHATTVTWTLTPQNGDTLLLLEHSGFSGALDTVIAQVFEYAWQRLLSNLRTTLNAMGRETPPD